VKYGSNKVRALYYSLPITAKNLLASAYGWNERRVRYGKTYHQSLAMLRESQYWSNEQLIEYQHERVQRFLADVVSKTTYYRDHVPYSELVKAQAPLAAYPLLSKATVRREGGNFYHDDLAAMRCRWQSTSGTTGAALTSPLSEEHFQRECAFRALAYEWAGVSLAGQEKVAFCAGHPVADANRQRPPFWVHDWANNWLYFSSYHLTRRNLQNYIDELARFQPVMLGGYPSSLYLLALAYQKSTARLQLRAISTSSETLFDWQRAKIEEAFGAKVFNYYGTGETCANIAECESGELHLKLEHSAVEVLNDRNEPCGPGESGRLVCTGFSNYAFPLVRYELGDVVTISKDQVSACGRGGLLLDSILGRVEDYIVTPDGRFVGRLDHLFKDSANVAEAQLFQENVSEVICRIVKNDGYGIADEQKILEEARLRLGAEIKIKFEYLDQLPRTRNGKSRFVISTLNQSEMLDTLSQSGRYHLR
jgi:phenylacetate-CoA ligase